MPRSHAPLQNRSQDRIRIPRCSHHHHQRVRPLGRGQPDPRWSRVHRWSDGLCLFVGLDAPAGGVSLGPFLPFRPSMLAVGVGVNVAGAPIFSAATLACWAYHLSLFFREPQRHLLLGGMSAAPVSIVSLWGTVNRSASNWAEGTAVTWVWLVGETD